MNLEDMTLDIVQQVQVKASQEKAFRSVLYRLGEGNTVAGGGSLEMNLEEFAGGRWFRDRGEGIQHLWGHVQVIKPNSLIEISGQMFMSYPAINHLEVKLAENDGTTTITLRHRALGMLSPEHREGIEEGWHKVLELVRSDFAGDSHP